MAKFLHPERRSRTDQASSDDCDGAARPAASGSAVNASSGSEAIDIQMWLNSARGRSASVAAIMRSAVASSSRDDAQATFTLTACSTGCLSLAKAADGITATP